MLAIRHARRIRVPRRTSIALTSSFRPPTRRVILLPRADCCNLLLISPLFVAFWTLILRCSAAVSRRCYSAETHASTVACCTIEPNLSRSRRRPGPIRQLTEHLTNGSRPSPGSTRAAAAQHPGMTCRVIALRFRMPQNPRAGGGLS